MVAVMFSAASSGLIAAASAAFCRTSIVMCRGSPWSAFGSPQPHDRHMGPPSNASSPAFPEPGIVTTYFADAGIARVERRSRRYPPPMLLVLIRHGVTAATDGGVLAGWTPGVHLTDPGREQAERLAARLDGVTIHSIYASPLERCRETAAPLAAGRDLRRPTRAAPRAVRHGSWTGRNVKLLARTNLWKVVHQVPSRARFPGGESLLEVQYRMVGELERIATAKDRKSGG